MTDLEDLHELPWSAVEDAYIRVQVTSTDHGDPLTEEVKRTVETREGTIAGRHRGWKVKWLPDDGDFADPVSPIVVIETSKGTYLEVATDTLQNELLEFEPATDDREVRTDGGSSTSGTERNAEETMTMKNAPEHGPLTLLRMAWDRYVQTEADRDE